MNAPQANFRQDETLDPFATARFNVEWELLGGLFEASTAHYRAAAAIVGPEDFNDHFNARAFAMMGEAADAGIEGQAMRFWLRDRLRVDASLAEAGLTPRAVFEQWVHAACPPIGIEATAQMIKIASLKDQVALAIEESRHADVAEMSAEMDRLSTVPMAAGAFQPVGDVAMGIIDRMNDAFQNGKPARDYAYAGLGSLASRIGGWRRGRFYVLGGRPGIGKSTVALSLLLNTAKAGHGVILFSLEMGKDELAEMALCNLARSATRVEYRDLNPSNAERGDYAEMFAAVHAVQPRLAALPLEIVDRAGLTLGQIREAAVRYAKELSNNGKRLEVLAIDHLNLIKASDRYRGNKVAETEETSNALKVLAKELDCAVVCLVQLSRANEAREDKRPGLSDMRWSGSIEQDADVVMFVYREAYYLEHSKHDDLDEENKRLARLDIVKNQLEIQIAKQRGGPTGTLELFCDLGCAYVGDLDRR